MPKPVCKCFILCRGLFVDPASQAYTIVSPVYQVYSPRYPIVEDFSVYARWTNSHGSYAIEVQLRSLEGDVLCGCKVKKPFETHKPLQIWQIPLHHMRFEIPGPGKYDVVMLANSEVVATDTLLAHET